MLLDVMLGLKCCRMGGACVEPIAMGWEAFVERSALAVRPE
jgi:hypothetical protein